MLSVLVCILEIKNKSKLLKKENAKLKLELKQAEAYKPRENYTFIAYHEEKKTFVLCSLSNRSFSRLFDYLRKTNEPTVITVSLIEKIFKEAQCFISKVH